MNVGGGGTVTTWSRYVDSLHELKIPSSFATWR